MVRGLAGTAFAAVGLGRLATDVAAKGEKALICHYTGSTANPFNLIEVSTSAVAAHEAHGDHLAFDCGDGPQCTACPPEQCTIGEVGAISGNPWTVCRIDTNSAWLSSTTSGIYDPLAACQSIGFSSVGQFGGNCGSVCGWCEEVTVTSCEDLGTEKYDGNPGICGWNGETGNLCYTVSWECLA